MYKGQKRRANRKAWLGLAISGFFLTIIALSWAFSSRRVAADEPFAEIFRANGRYEFLAQGVGTRGNPGTGAWTGTGQVVLEIPATATIHHARLVWTGRSADDGNGNPVFDADGVTLQVDSDTPTVIAADKQFNQSPWFSNGGEAIQQLQESADVLSLIQPGTHTYTISDHEHGTSPTGNSLNYGVGIWLVYSDNSVAPGEVAVYEGQDSFFRNWRPPRGPNTEVHCADFDPDPTNPRTLDMIHFVSGVDLLADPNQLRSDAFWYMVGSGAKPDQAEVPGLINLPGATGYAPAGQYPLRSANQLEWDNFNPSIDIDIPAGASWICFQIESGDSEDLAGLNNAGTAASGMWNFFAIKLPNFATAVELLSFDVRPSTGLQAVLSWETAVEIDNFGFNLYRAESPEWQNAVQINNSIIPGSGGVGQKYEYTDTAPAFGQWWYWLEDVETDGTKTRHTAVQVLLSRIKSLYLPVIVNQP